MGKQQIGPAVAPVAGAALPVYVTLRPWPFGATGLPALPLNITLCAGSSCQVARSGLYFSNDGESLAFPRQGYDVITGFAAVSFIGLVYGGWTVIQIPSQRVDWMPQAYAWGDGAHSGILIANGVLTIPTAEALLLSYGPQGLQTAGLAPVKWLGTQAYNLNIPTGGLGGGA